MAVDTAARISPDDGSATGQILHLASSEGDSDDHSALPPQQTDTTVPPHAADIVRSGKSTRSLNEAFCKDVLDFRARNGALNTAEKICDEWAITVEPSADPSLLLDLEAFHETYGRLSEISDSDEVRALRKNANYDALNALADRRRTRLRQLYNAVRDKVNEWDTSLRTSHAAICDLIDRDLDSSARPLRSNCLCVAKLARTTFAQSIRDCERLDSAYYRLAPLVDIDEPNGGWEQEARECHAYRSRFVGDLDEKIDRLSRHIEEDAASTDAPSTSNFCEGHPDEEIEDDARLAMTGDHSSDVTDGGDIVDQGRATAPVGGPRVEHDDQEKDTGAQDDAVSDDGRPTTPSSTQSGVYGDEGGHGVEEKQHSDEGVTEFVHETTSPSIISSSLVLGMNWADVDGSDDESASSNSSSAASGSDTQPISYAAAVADGLNSPSTPPTHTTRPATGMTSVATAIVSPRPLLSSRRDCPQILRRPPDVTGGATAGEPRRHIQTSTCAPTDTSLAASSTRKKQKSKQKKSRKSKKTDSMRRQNVGGRQAIGAPAPAVLHDDTSDDRSHHSSVPAAGPRQEVSSSAPHEHQLWPAASHYNNTQQGRGALVNGVNPRSDWGQKVERKMSLEILQLNSVLDQVQKQSVRESTLARREIEMLELKLTRLRQENERLRIELSDCTAVLAQPCDDVDDDVTVAASNCNGHALSNDALARAGTPLSQTLMRDVDTFFPAVQGGVDRRIPDIVPGTALQEMVVTPSTPTTEDVAIVSHTDQGRAPRTELALGPVDDTSSTAPPFDQGREHRTGATEEAAGLSSAHPTDRGRDELGQLHDLASSTPPPLEAIRQTTSTGGLQDIGGLPKPKRKRRRGKRKRRRKGKGKSKRRPGHSPATRSNSNESVSNHAATNSSQHINTRSRYNCKSRRPVTRSYKSSGTRRIQSLFKESYTGYIPSSGFYYREVRLSPTSRPMFVEGGFLKPAKAEMDQNLRESHAKEVSLEPLDWTGCYLTW